MKILCLLAVGLGIAQCCTSYSTAKYACGIDRNNNKWKGTPNHIDGYDNEVVGRVNDVLGVYNNVRGVGNFVKGLNNVVQGNGNEVTTTLGEGVSRVRGNRIESIPTPRQTNIARSNLVVVQTLEQAPICGTTKRSIGEGHGLIGRKPITEPEHTKPVVVLQSQPTQNPVRPITFSGPNKNGRLDPVGEFGGDPFFKSKLHAKHNLHH